MTAEPIHPCVNKIKSLIEKNQMWYDYMEHKPVRTSAEAAEVRGDKYTQSQGAKALIVRIREYGGKKYFGMIVVPGDLRFDQKKAKEYLNAKDIRFATEDEVSEITDGVLVGGVPPFGNLFNLPVFVDNKVVENEVIVFNAGDKRVTIAIFTKDYQELVNPQVADLT